MIVSVGWRVQPVTPASASDPAISARKRRRLASEISTPVFAELFLFRQRSALRIRQGFPTGACPAQQRFERDEAEILIHSSSVASGTAGHTMNVVFRHELRS